MGLKPAASILLIVNSKGTILYSNKESTSLLSKGKIENIGDFYFKPKLSNILKSYHSLSDENSSVRQSYNVINISTDKKYTTIVKRMTDGENCLFLLELNPVDDIDEADIDTGIQRSANENDQFLIIADGTGAITFLSDAAKNFLIDPVNPGSINNLYDLVLSSFDFKKINEYRTALVDGKFWQTDAAISAHKDKFIRLKLFPLHNEANRVSSFMMFGDEISSLVKVKLAYIKAGELAKAVIDNIPGLVAILKGKDEELILADANPAFVNTFILPKKMMFNRSIEKIFTADFVNIIKRKINTAIVKNKSYFEYTLTQKETIYFGGKIVMLKGLTEDVSFYIITMRDITDILKYEKELKKSYDRDDYVSKLKTSFLINMATEIRTPFNSIMSYADLIDDYLNEKDYDSAKELLDSTKDVLKRVVNLFTNITEVAQIETGEVQIIKETLDCNELIKLSFNKIEEDIKDSGLDFGMSLYPGALLIKADWVKIERVMFLLLDNAIRTSSRGKIAVKTDILNGNANIKIFYAGHTSIENDAEQDVDEEENDLTEISLLEVDELGITIASHYTKLMGGEFYIENKGGRGSDITLSFPLIKK